MGMLLMEWIRWTLFKHRMRIRPNEHGVLVSHLKCRACAVDFSVTPAVGQHNFKGWMDCLTPDCSSYDPHRDIDVLMGEPPPKGHPISLDIQRRKVERL